MTIAVRSDVAGGALVVDAVQKLIFDAAGNATLQNGALKQSKVRRNFFSAYLPGLYGNLPVNTWTLIRTYTEIIDSAGTFEPTTTGQFKPNVAGWYQISAGLTIVGDPSSITIASIFKNGASHRRLGGIVTASTVSNVTHAGSFPIYFNGTTDYVDMRGYCNATGTSAYGDANGEYTTISGYLIEAD